MDGFFEAVATIGFPSACCAFLLYQNAQQDKYAREYQEKLRKTIESNTKSIEQLSKLISAFVQKSEKGGELP